MNIRDPDVAAHVAKCMTLDAGKMESEVKEIMSLIDAGGFFCHTKHDWPEGDDWVPESNQMKEVVSLLTAPENRTALRKWYKRHDGLELNQGALAFRRMLSRMTGEKL